MLLHGCFSFRKVVRVNFPYSPASQPTGSSDVRVCVLGGRDSLVAFTAAHVFRLRSFETLL